MTSFFVLFGAPNPRVENVALMLKRRVLYFKKDTLVSKLLTLIEQVRFSIF